MSSIPVARVGGHRPVSGVRPTVGRMPTVPQKCDGARIEPPPSVPIPAIDASAPSSAASPPDEPPGVWAPSSGCSVQPDEQVVRLEGARALGCVRLRDDHRARGAQARDDRGVAERPVAGRASEPAAVRQPGDVEDVLDGQREAEQDGVIARRAAGVGRVGCCEGIVVAPLGDRVERGRVAAARGSARSARAS